MRSLQPVLVSCLVRPAIGPDTLPGSIRLLEIHRHAEGLAGDIADGNRGVIGAGRSHLETVADEFGAKARADELVIADFPRDGVGFTGPLNLDRAGVLTTAIGIAALDLIGTRGIGKGGDGLRGKEKA
jgi:hypothetical protein